MFTIISEKLYLTIPEILNFTAKKKCKLTLLNSIQTEKTSGFSSIFLSPNGEGSRLIKFIHLMVLGS